MAVRSTKRALAGEIADAILHQQFAPGQWLRHVDVEERFRASRTEVRGALEELAVRRMIEHVPNRGYRVPSADPRAYRHIAEARILLEAGVASTIVVAMDEGGLARLRDLAQAFSEAVNSGLREDLSRANNAFHRFMYGYCRNPVVEEMILALRERSRGAGGVAWQSHDALMRSDADHRDMIDAIADRDASRLTRAITAHIAKGIPKTI